MASLPGYYSLADYGADATGTTPANTAIIDAFAAAEAGGGFRTVFAPAGTYQISGSLSLAGYSSGLLGVGPGTVFRASAQTGPVLDFTAYKTVPQLVHGQEFANFQVQGDGTAGSGKIGLLLPHITNAVFRGIGISQTGGSCLSLSNSELCRFEQITLQQPIGANANDVPYLYFAGGGGGNLFAHCGLCNQTNDPDPPTACLVIEDGGGQEPSFTQFRDCWLENLHLPDGAVAVLTRSSGIQHSDWQIFDTGSAVPSPSSNAYFSFQPSGSNPSGGSCSLRGYIPGRGTNTSSIAWGVIVGQSRLGIQGIRGYRGNNVLLQAGVQRVSILFIGEESGSDSVPAVVDQSGQTNNLCIDMPTLSVPVGSLTPGWLR